MPMYRIAYKCSYDEGFNGETFSKIDTRDYAITDKITYVKLHELEEQICHGEWDDFFAKRGGGAYHLFENCFLCKILAITKLED